MKRLAPRALAVVLALLAVPASAATLHGFTPRLEALALLQTLNADLLSHDSATAVLQGWCDDHRLAPGAKMAAKLVRGADKPLPEAARALIGDAPVRYRRVQLSCGRRILSEADNWYRPDPLTPEMNRLLDETDTPFGVAVRDLAFRRRNLSAELLFRPLPRGWENGPRPQGAVPVPAEVLRHAAILTTGAGVPFSYVVETYSGSVLDITPAHRTAPSRP